jgi:transposase
MRSFSMSYVQGEDRGQAPLLPAAIEDYVAADAPVRVIDAFVDGLDVRGLGFGRSIPAATGRPKVCTEKTIELIVIVQTVQTVQSLYSSQSPTTFHLEFCTRTVCTACTNPYS